MPIGRTTNEDLLFTTVRIAVGGDETGSAGTAFIVKYPLKHDPNLHYEFLISCKHLFEEEHETILMNFHRHEAGTVPPRPVLGQSIPVEFEGFESGFFAHPESEADLACVHINQLTAHLDRSGNTAFRLHVPLELFATFDEESLLPGQRIFFVGYPEDEYDDMNNLPLLRSGRISSHPKINYRNQPAFVIDAQVHKGSSGSPVFGVFGSEVRLIGILRRLVFASERLEGMPDDIPLAVRHRLGLGVVVKSTKIRELLDFAYNECERRTAEDQSAP